MRLCGVWRLVCAGLLSLDFERLLPFCCPRPSTLDVREQTMTLAVQYCARIGKRKVRHSFDG